MPSFIEASRQPASASNCFVKTTTGTYVLPFLCRWSEGSWHNATSGHLVEAQVLGWRFRQG